MKDFTQHLIESSFFIERRFMQFLSRINGKHKSKRELNETMVSTVLLDDM